MDITGLDLAQLGTCLGSLATAAKAIKDNRHLVKERAQTKIERDEEVRKMQMTIVRLETEHNHVVERLNLGDARFDKMERKLDGVMDKQDITNQELAELKGILKRALGDKVRKDD